MIDLRARLLDKRTAKVREAAKDNFDRFRRDFSPYSADSTVYEDANGQVVARGQSALESQLWSSQDLVDTG